MSNLVSYYRTLGTMVHWIGYTLCCSLEYIWIGITFIVLPNIFGYPHYNIHNKSSLLIIGCKEPYISLVHINWTMTYYEINEFSTLCFLNINCSTDRYPFQPSNNFIENRDKIFARLLVQSISISCFRVLCLHKTAL